MTGRQPQPAELLADLRRRYEDGATVRQLATETGRAPSTIHGWLTTAGTVMRHPRGANRKPKDRP